MNILLLLAHPEPGSLNHAIAQCSQDELRLLGHTVVFHDLCAEGFDPLLPAGEPSRNAALPEAISRHCRELTQADGIVIVHPNWWGQPPAILKGWIDRVIRPGVAYAFVGDDKGEGVPVGLLKARAACIFNTCNTEAERERLVFGDPLDAIWKKCVFGLCGVSNVMRRVYGVVITSQHQQRQQWLDDVRACIRQQFPAE